VREFDVRRRFQQGTGDLAPFLDDGVGGLGTNDPSRIERAEAEADASLHAVGVVGDEPNPLGLDPESFANDLGKARLVALTRRHRP
jgi:hypothetical protein